MAILVFKALLLKKLAFEPYPLNVVLMDNLSIFRGIITLYKLLLMIGTGFSSCCSVPTKLAHEYSDTIHSML